MESPETAHGSDCHGEGNSGREIVRGSSNRETCGVVDRQLPRNDGSWPDLDNEALFRACERWDALRFYWDYMQVRRLGFGIVLLLGECDLERQTLKLSLPSRLWAGMWAGGKEYGMLQRCCPKQGLKSRPAARDAPGL